MAALRLFLGVGLEQPLQRIVQDWRQQQDASLRWVADSNLHMTVVFLGMTEDSRIPLLADVVMAHTQQHGAFSLAWQTVDWFPSAAKARVLAWLPAAAEDFACWQAGLVAQLRRAGVAVERKPYRPHISLARVRRAEPALSLPQPLHATMAVTAITLFRSDSTADGVRYTPMQHWPMKKPV
ncbi:MAG: RNA 2',3'-cyclic phosphodiesterase [Gammaproteobacteria bacterium]|nr:MAG: RNA 2',3'-cyclic phosphodiesterase [Gammaproteobacteria bacterium]